MNIAQRRAAVLTAVTAISVFLLTNLVFFKGSCEQVEESFLRLHVIADSDSAEDQRLKLLVRDRLLESAADIFDGSIETSRAIEKITPECPRLKACAEAVLRENGCTDSVAVTVSKEFFNTRVYDELTLPAGEYTALRVVIGEGKGKNWWCIMFPPLCLPAAESSAAPSRNGAEDAAVLTDGQRSIVENPTKYAVRFKIVEWYEHIRERLSE